MSFVLSKILWFMTAPGNMLVVLILLGGLMTTVKREWVARAGRRLIITLGVVSILVAVFPVGDWAIAPLENQFPFSAPERVDGIIMLGGDENARITDRRGQPTAVGSSARYLMFATLARKYPDAKLVFTGGTELLNPYSHMKSAEVARQILEGVGVASERVIYEDMSRNTHENAVLTANIVHPTPEQNWLMVTSAYHMPRAMGIFRKAGWNVFPASTGYISDGRFDAPLEFNFLLHAINASIAIREYIGLVAAKMLGYSDSIWPS